MTNSIKCPKCPGFMRTHTKGNVHIEQCDNCRGIFLDYGEIEALTQMQNQWVNQAANPAYQNQPPPQPMQPSWGAPPHQQQHYNPRYYKKRGFLGMLFSS